MDKQGQARARAMELLLDHDLDNWDVQINAKRTTLAETHHYDKTLWISKYFIKAASKEEFDETIKHEIAHMLLGPGHGHGDEFIDMCRSINVDERYITTAVETNTLTYKLSCPICGASGYANKKYIFCADCFKNDIYIQYIPEANRIKEVPWD